VAGQALATQGDMGPGATTSKMGESRGDEMGKPSAGPNVSDERSRRSSLGTQGNPQDQNFTSLPSGALPISDFYHQSVHDPQDNKIGDTEDLLVNQNGKIDAAIIGVGGFLGVGEKNVSVPFNSLKLADKNGKRYVVMNTTKETLKNATPLIAPPLSGCQPSKADNEVAKFSTERSGLTDLLFLRGLKASKRSAG
jgi:hypothetical protein